MYNTKWQSVIYEMGMGYSLRYSNQLARSLKRCTVNVDGRRDAPANTFMLYHLCSIYMSYIVYAISSSNDCQIGRL